MKKFGIKFAIFSALCANLAFGAQAVLGENFLQISGANVTPFGISEDEIAKCSPKISGVYEYSGEGEIKFYPKTALNAGTVYNCKINNENFSFETEPLKITNFKILRAGFATIGFNDEISEDEVKKGIRVYSLQNLAKNDVTFSINSRQNRDFFISYDPKASNIVIEAGGIKSKFGANLQENKLIKYDEEMFEDRINASDFDDIKIRPAQFENGSLGARLYFPHYIYNSDLAKFIRIGGIAKFSVSEVEYRGSADEKAFPQISDKYYTYVDIKSDEFAPNSDYEVRLLKGFGDDERIMRKEMKFDIKTGDRAPFVVFSDDKPFVPKTANIAIKSANLNDVKIAVSKIGEDNFRYFLNFDNYNVNTLASDVISKSFDIGAAKNEIVEHKLAMDFRGFEDGVYLIKAFYKVGSQLHEISRKAYISDISAQVTLAQNGALIYASRLSNAKALSHAIIKIYNNKNELILEKRTDSDGILHIQNTQILGKNPRSIEISDGKERGFVLFDEAVFDGDQTTSNARAMLYFASELIAPNEELLGTIVLKKADFSPIANTPIKYKITDPNGVNVATRAVKTDSYGALNIKEQIGEKSGIYDFALIYEDKVIENKKFSVENFIPNRIKNQILTDKDEYYSGDLIVAKFISNYLVGAPAANLGASIESKISEKELKIKGYEGFSFQNAKLKKSSMKTLNDEKFSLNQNGEKELVIAPKGIEVSNAANVLIGFSVQDGGKNVSEYKQISVFPYDKILGIRANKDFIASGEEVVLNTALLDSRTKKPQKGKIDIEIYRQDYNYLYDGYRYKEQEIFSLIDTISSENSHLNYKFSQGGVYLIVANDYLSGASASVRVDVSGYGYYARLNAKDIQTARITLEKSKVKPGEIIRGVVTSPIENGILNVSLVNGSVQDFKITQIKGNSANFELRAPENFGGGHISASISRAATPAAMPLRTYANVPISLDISEKNAPVSIQTAPSYKNGQKAAITVKSAPNSKIVLYAVDLGILDVIKQKELNAFSYFDKPLFYKMKYFDVFDELSVYSTNAKELSFGGDEMLKSAKRNLSPVENKKDKKFIKMSEAITDSEGVAKFELNLPKNFNSMLRLSALMLSDEQKIGSANVEISVKDDIVVKPADLVYMVRGDDIDLPLTLINTTNSKKSLALKIGANDNIKIAGADQNLSLEALGSSNLKIKTKALDLGEGSIKFEVVSENEKFEHELKFDVISQFPRSKFMVTNYGSEEQKFSLDPSYKEVFAYFGTRPSTHAVARDLQKYPYGCTEQLSSKLLALNFFAKRDHDEDMKTAAKNHAVKILSRLKTNGEFGYWSANSNVNKFASVYASDVLLEFDESEKILTPKQKELILTGLKSAYNGNYSLRVYADFVLEKYGKLGDDELNFILDKKLHIVSPLANAATLAILQNRKMNNEFNEVGKTGVMAKFNYGTDEANAIFATETRDLAFFVYSLAKFGVKNSDLDALGLKLARNLADLSSTQERGFVLRALEEYFKDEDRGVDVTVSANGNLQTLTTPANMLIKLNSGNNEIKIAPQNGEKVFSSLVSFGYEPVARRHKMFNLNEFKSKRNRSIEIYREFVDEAGNIVDLDDLKVGQRIYSKVNYYSNFHLRNFVIDEGVSTCFEIINERLTNSFVRPEALSDNANFEHKEYMFDRVVSFPVDASYLSSKDFYYYGWFYTPLNVVFAGSCALPAVSITYMQDERITDYDMQTLKFSVK